MKYFIYLREDGTIIKVKTSVKREKYFNLYGTCLSLGGSFNLKTGFYMLPNFMLPLLEYLKQ